MTKLKLCPFCGREASLNENSERIGYDAYERRIHHYVVSCNACGGHAKIINKAPLCDFTEYNVQDFRENPALRARVEDEYEEYTLYQKQLAKEAWNMRFGEE